MSKGEVSFHTEGEVASEEDSFIMTSSLSDLPELERADEDVPLHVEEDVLAISSSSSSSAMRLALQLIS